MGIMREIWYQGQDEPIINFFRLSASGAKGRERIF
jgi:hypothetical protein